MYSLSCSKSPYSRAYLSEETTFALRYRHAFLTGVCAHIVAQHIHEHCIHVLCHTCVCSGNALKEDSTHLTPVAALKMMAPTLQASAATTSLTSPSNSSRYSQSSYSFMPVSSSGDEKSSVPLRAILLTRSSGPVQKRESSFRRRLYLFMLNGCLGCLSPKLLGDMVGLMHADRACISGCVVQGRT